MLNRFLPDDDPSTDGPQHTHIRAIAKVDIIDEYNDVPFTQQEVNRIVRRMSDKKAPGEDGISANIVRALTDIAPSLLTEMYNACFRYSCFPRCFKSSTVRAVPKNSNTSCDTIKAWRPISLLPLLGKILERLLADRTLYSLNERHALSDRQFGFTAGKSTVTAVTTATKFIHDVRQKKAVGALVSLDISGAFDNAWWDAILLAMITRKVPTNLVQM